MMTPDELRYRNALICKCGKAKTFGSRSCRTCYRAGRGVKPGKRGRTIESILNEVNAMDLKPGQSVTFAGMRITKK